MRPQHLSYHFFCCFLSLLHASSLLVLCRFLLLSKQPLCSLLVLSIFPPLSLSLSLASLTHIDCPFLLSISVFPFQSLLFDSSLHTLLNTYMFQHLHLTRFAPIMAESTFLGHLFPMLSEFSDAVIKLNIKHHYCCHQLV